MHIIPNATKQLTHLLAACLLVSAPGVIAENARHGRGHSPHTSAHQHAKDRSGGHEAYQFQGYRFSDADRRAIREYYAQQYRSANCPPGLKKKRNGCLPPGQAKKWAIGRPLPRDVIYYEVPPHLIGPLPTGYRLARVASDILMIAIGSGMVIDAITDLNQIP
ncbi:hypothetical protein [Methylomonas koyamae]|uniref:Uncharacterized protein n=1 Tax=Methylomonas koyamae TaxID=702114 RepID=A0A291IMB7_9GAMM|nr:hypothetical protein [Methylomonas koyamae]ATG91423.1 hypothetical protein MKLM6_3231 [Methylomonas koyamae]OAI26815.1 hypothetical protein A1356_10385 [Methylomonas koyamae]